MSVFDFRVWILFATVSCVIAAVQVGDITTVCKRNDPNLSECMKNSAHSIRSKLGKGIKQLRIPKMDPMIIPKVHLASGGGPVSLDSTFTNVEVEGLSNYEIKNINIDFDRKEIQAEAFVPVLNMKSQYETNGKILNLPITGSGDSHSKYTGVKANIKLKFKPENRNGQEYWNLEKSDFDVDVQHADIYLDNLFNGNKQLGDTMNTLIAENWQLVFQEMKPAVRDTVNALVSDMTSKVFNHFSLEELFPSQ
ncbi:UNVERIFIED_CONTAM: hypothetical protein PYX00_002465 [Menopon gallinae]